MSNPMHSQPPWQPWHLTAYVLGELEPDLAEKLEAAADQDAQLSAEITSIRHTIEDVREALALEDAGVDDASSSATSPASNRLQSILAKAARTNTENVPSTKHELLPASPPGSYRRLVWAGLTTLAACLVVAIIWTSNYPTYRQVAVDSATNIYPGTVKAAPETANASPHTSPHDSTAHDSTAQDSTFHATAQESENASNLASLSGHGTQPTSSAHGNSLLSLPPNRSDSESVATRNVDPAPFSGETAGPPMHVEKSRATSGPQDSSSSLARNHVAAQSQIDSQAGQLDVFDEKSIPSSIRSQESDGRLETYKKEEADLIATPALGGATDEPALPVEGLSKQTVANKTPASQVESPTATTDFYDSSSVPSSLQTLAQIENRESSFRSKHSARGAEARKVDRFRRQAILESSGDRFSTVAENTFRSVADAPLSTFSIDVDSASYSKSRQFLLEANRLPPAGAVRLEEFVNYFDYEYAGPKSDDPFGANLAVATCPWQADHKLVRIALQAEKLDIQNRPKANIVFLLDVSGSMDEPNKLPLVKESMRLLVRQLGENDHVAIVVYAGAAGCVLEGTRGDNQKKILGALNRLNAGGSTNGGQGIQLAYDLARDHFVPGGINRVLLCTDGDFNVGLTDTEALVRMVEENAKSKIFLTVLGYGMGNTNDSMMEQISNRGDGIYGFVDNIREARRQMIRQLAGNLMTVAKDVKIQVEFNPAKVQAYRLLGYENRTLAAEDFNDDAKDAGEIGAGHRVTAIYQIVPVGTSGQSEPGVDSLRYQSESSTRKSTQEEPRGENQDELLAVKLRYKQPEGDKSKLLIFPLKDRSSEFESSDRDFRWAASMVEFGMLLRNSSFRGDASWRGLLERATSAAGISPDADRRECLDMMQRAASLSR